MQNLFEEQDENLNKIIDSHTQIIKNLEALINKHKADSNRKSLRGNDNVTTTASTGSTITRKYSSITYKHNSYNVKKQWNEEYASIYQKINGLDERQQQLEGRIRMEKQQTGRRHENLQIRVLQLRNTYTVRAHYISQAHQQLKPRVLVKIYSPRRIANTPEQFIKDN